MDEKITRESKMAIKCGGYELDPEPCINGALPEKIASAFGEVFHGFTGASYTPLVYCGSQLVCGKNYAIICKVKYVNNELPTGVAMVILHETLIPKGAIMGKFSLLSITDIAKSGGYDGYFMTPYAHQYKEGSDDPIDKIFDNLEVEGSKFVPLAYCGFKSASDDEASMMFICASSMVVAGKEETTVDHIDTVVLHITDDTHTLESVTELL